MHEALTVVVYSRLYPGDNHNWVAIRTVTFIELLSKFAYEHRTSFTVPTALKYYFHGSVVSITLPFHRLRR